RSGRWPCREPIVSVSRGPGNPHDDPGDRRREECGVRGHGSGPCREPAADGGQGGEHRGAGRRAREARAGVPAREPRDGDRRGGEPGAGEPGAPRVGGPESRNGGEHQEAGPRDVGIRRPGVHCYDVPERQRRRHEEKEHGENARRDECATAGRREGERGELYDPGGGRRGERELRRDVHSIGTPADRGERQRQEKRRSGRGSAPCERAQRREQGERAADERERRAQRVRCGSRRAALGWPKVSAGCDAARLHAVHGVAATVTPITTTVSTTPAAPTRTPPSPTGRRAARRVMPTNAAVAESASAGGRGTPTSRATSAI